MWSFVFGSAVGYLALNNGPLLRRALTWAIVKAEDGFGTAGKEARRMGVRIVEDVQDIMAEATAQREADRSQNMGQTTSAGHNLDVN